MGNCYLVSDGWTMRSEQGKFPAVVSMTVKEDSMLYSEHLPKHVARSRACRNT
jgi:hypothetical protein